MYVLLSACDDVSAGLLGVGISTIVVPFSSSLWMFMLVSTLVSAFQAYLYPLSNSLLSRSVDAREQGSLLGGAESFISLGGEQISSSFFSSSKESWLHSSPACFCPSVSICRSPSEPSCVPHLLSSSPLFYGLEECSIDSLFVLSFF